MTGHVSGEKNLDDSFLSKWFSVYSTMKDHLCIFVCMFVYTSICVFIHTCTSKNKCVFIGDSLTPQKLQKKTKVLEFGGWEGG